ncbi:hypothetical protein KQX54_017119 [Cotesia glomerata]|uniref:Uncharacterized protein n=1 Tax=Cotesia glomerata TaxID=32391 RepID=A0AAV7HSE1_COTGL|nr:hypothetical protein KQX54_017119 [Cotesia glomerata]
MFIDGKYQHICIAPKEWAIHKTESVEKMMIDSCLNHRKKTSCIHGANTQISSVSTKLEYYDLKLWFKRTDDISTKPNSGSYFSMMLHLPESKCKHLCWVPCPWDEYPSVFMGLILHSEVASHYRQTNKIEGTRIRVDGNVAVLRNYKNQIWMKNEKDNRKKPDRKSYTGIFMPCITTSEL